MTEVPKIGRFRLHGTLGAAMIGVYHHARDERFDREVTLKVMPADQAGDPEKKARFEREAKCLALLQHQSVIGIYELGYEQGVPYLALEALRGTTLRQRLQQGGIRLDRGLSLFVRMLGGLEHVHAAGIVNRSLNPAAIFVQEDGSPKIMDFSMCRFMTSVSRVGIVVGVPDYMSAEQVKGLTVDGRSDLFGVGCMLYEIVADRPPFQAETAAETFYRILKEEPDYRLIPEGPARDPLLSVLRKALAKEPADRYPDARALSADLQQVLATISGG